MFGPLRLHLSRSACRLVVWCLLVSVPLYGFSGTLVTLLGSQHVHATAVRSAALVEPPIGAAKLESAETVSWIVLEDFRRLPSSRPRLHGHSHSAIERHHHSADDVTVVSLDGGHHDGSGSDEGGGSTTAAHVLALSDAVAFAMPALAAFAWSAAASSLVDPWMGDGLERPPKA